MIIKNTFVEISKNSIINFFSTLFFEVCATSKITEIKGVMEALSFLNISYKIYKEANLWVRFIIYFLSNE